VTGEIGARVVVVTLGGRVVVGDDTLDVARVVVEGGWADPPPRVFEPAPAPVVFVLFALDDRALVALVLKPSDVPTCGDELVLLEDVPLLAGVDVSAARAFAAFAACATNIPVASPELRKIAWVRSRTRANFFAIG
jgi:hypothetical protein